MSQPHDVLFKALADPTRRAIFERLCRDGELTVSDMTTHAGISQPAVSKHLAALRRAGLVRDRQDGRHSRYTADARALSPLRDWADDMTRFWESRMDGLEALLKRMDQ